MIITLTQGLLGRPYMLKITHRHSRVALSLIGIVIGFIVAFPKTWIECLPFLAFSISKTAERHLSVRSIKQEQMVSLSIWTIYSGLVLNFAVLLLNAILIIAYGYWFYRQAMLKKHAIVNESLVETDL
jgi:hypothetical protein